MAQNRIFEERRRQDIKINYKNCTDYKILKYTK